MCDVMPTISEDSLSQRSSQFGDDANFEQLMVSMLDERDKLVESLKNEQEKTTDLEHRVKELEKERDSLNRQLNQNLPQVRKLKDSQKKRPKIEKNLRKNAIFVEISQMTVYTKVFVLKF